MRALFIQHDHVSPTGPVGEAYRLRGFEIDEFLVVPEDSFHAPSVPAAFPDPTAYDVVVPMGAPWSVYDEASIGAWVNDELSMLRAAIEADVPVLGICFGGQALAAALGGAVAPAERAEIGWTQIRTAQPQLVDTGPWFEWHADRWLLPAHAQPIAWTDVTEQAFVAGRSMGVQFHPEVTPEMLRGWFANGGAAHARQAGLDPDLMMRDTERHAAAAASRAARLVDAFLELAGLQTLDEHGARP